VGVAVADRRQTMRCGEADDPAVPRPAEHRRIEGLDRVRAHPRIAIGQQPPDHPTLRA